MATDVENERAQAILEAEAHRAKVVEENFNEGLGSYLNIPGMDNVTGGIKNLMDKDDGIRGWLNERSYYGLGGIVDALAGGEPMSYEPVSDGMGHELNSLGDEVTGVRSDEPAGVSVDGDASSPQRQAEDEGLDMT